MLSLQDDFEPVLVPLGLIATLSVCGGKKGYWQTDTSSSSEIEIRTRDFRLLKLMFDSPRARIEVY